MISLGTAFSYMCLWMSKKDTESKNGLSGASEPPSRLQFLIGSLLQLWCQGHWHGLLQRKEHSALLRSDAVGGNGSSDSSCLKASGESESLDWEAGAWTIREVSEMVGYLLR